MRGLIRTLEANSKAAIETQSTLALPGVGYLLASKSLAIRVRIAASGMGAIPAWMLSCMCSGREVAGMTQVTAGCETMYFRNTCAQLVQPISFA